MGFLTDWITNIILLILLATILELMIPNSVLQKYVKMVVGLLLLVMILQPILSLITKDVDQWLISITQQSHQLESSIEQEINLQKSDIELGLRAYISEQMAVQLEEEVKDELRDQYEVVISQVEVKMKESVNQTPTAEDIETVIVYLKDTHEGLTEADAAVAPVSVVKIDTSKQVPQEMKQETRDLTSVRRLLSTNWEVPEEMISLAWEGGE
ncbi:stage III sporulation protein AF [Alkalihalophilus pseudofirmus OF4]|uniref:Stage III sporulation protein AF n=1 Tax=Alkalihalophilus pseudofirmus (strain ATCC BAA-2126 / JCM 17055 / OF4) TaxID=398511 RepID=D3FUV5_ALKPO|nr:stage III sporulation protein AF [Alkalihalophilus pseudofirmus]ADC48381.1 stage III sporulation protein AF [Alkalihalophilus pseudofirmus OF4]